MSKLKNLVKRSQFKVMVGAGVLLLIVGVGLWLYTSSVIEGHERLLDTQNLTQEEVWRYEGSLQWWRTAYTTTFYPAAVVSIAMGLMVTLCPILWAIVQQTHARKSFSEDFQRAFNERLVSEE